MNAEQLSALVAAHPYGRLPLFPLLYGQPTEEKLERTIEQLFDYADRTLMEGGCTQEQYDAWAVKLKEWEQCPYV